MCFKIKACLKIKDSRTFKKWPVEYRWDEISTANVPITKRSSSTSTNATPLVQSPNPDALPPDSKPGRARTAQGSIIQVMKQRSSKAARYTLAHSIGRWLLYPGSVYLLNRVPLTLLVKGRTSLINDFHGKRAKLIACDGNKIDTMFVDRRKRRSLANRGTQLVICCEGNSSFYEMGCFYTPLKAGYSVLGWNHPGFARSTGKPYPQNDINAMDVVIQYAIHRLNFSLSDIALYGYSLGSYTATWAAMTYPQLGGLVLDASFDSLLPLAMKVVSKSLRKLVVQTVKEHFNLNVAKMLCKYPGPVLLIRRTLDEITTTQLCVESNLPAIKSNRANELLLQLLRCRYPGLFPREEDVVRQWLKADCPQMEALIYSYFYKVDEDWCLSTLRYYKSSLGTNTEFPWKIGEDLSPIRRKHLALFLTRKHMKNVETTHGRTLPPHEFELPWKV